IGVPLDPSFVPIVPLAGRYVDHFWTLLNDLRIPHATLVDLDLGRAHGGKKIVKGMIRKLQDAGKNFAENMYIGLILDLNDLNDLDDDQLLDDKEAFNWIKALREEGVYLSFPLDVDFSMLKAFPEAYQRPNPGGRGPRQDEDAIREKKVVTLKTGG